MKSTYSLVIDIKRNIYEQITLKQEDTKSRYLSITLTDDNLPLNLTSHTVKVFILKPDNTKVFNNVNILDATQGKIEIELTTQALALPGEIKIELAIYGVDTSILSTKIFSVNVEKTLRDDTAIESSNEFSALTNALGDIELAKESVGIVGSVNNELKKNITDGNKLHTDLNSDITNATNIKSGLETSIKNGNTAKTALDDSRQQAETTLAKIIQTGNKEFFIQANRFTLNSSSGFYETTLQHDCNSKAIIAYLYDDNGNLLPPVYRLVDFNNILIKLNSPIQIRVVINISYMSVLF